MARIYAGANGNKSILKPHFAERPLKELLDLLKISGSDKWSGSGPVTAEFSSSEASFVQIEVEGSEGAGQGWNAGWHLISMTPSEAKNRLALVHQ
jgi:hypothetical protein